MAGFFGGILSDGPMVARIPGLPSYAKDAPIDHIAQFTQGGSLGNPGRIDIFLAADTALLLDDA
jgi:hypothetical protein